MNEGVILDPKDNVNALAAAMDAPILPYAALVVELHQTGVLDAGRIANRIEERTTDPKLIDRIRAVLKRYAEWPARFSGK
jgi:hypothetical protein